MAVIDELMAFIRSLRESRIRVYNSVAVKNRAFWAVDQHYPEDKAHLVEATLPHINHEDRVVIVGGGKGTLPTHVARTGAHTVVYEAAQEQIELLQETQKLNGVTFDLHHAIVGETYDVYGTDENAAYVAPDDLTGDALLLDCEGAELDILPRPEFETVIVETHPNHDASTASVETLLTGNSRVVATDPIAGDVVVR